MAEDFEQYKIKDEEDNEGDDFSQFKVKDEEPKKDKGFLSKITESVGQFFENHPTIRQKTQELFTGTSPEMDEFRKSRGITDVKGPGLMEIPGVRRIGEKLREEGRASGDYWRGFRNSIYADALDLASSGFDPRAAGRGKQDTFGNIIEERIPPSRQLSNKGARFYSGGKPETTTEGIAYDYPETGHKFHVMPEEAKPIDVTPIRQAPRTEPPLDVARDFAPVGEEGNLIDIRQPGAIGKSADDLAMRRMQMEHNMGIEMPDELYPARKTEEPSFSREFKPDELFKGSEGKGLDKNASFEDQWQTALVEAKKVGLDPSKYDNLDQLQWDITRKAARDTFETGRNPLNEDISHAKAGEGKVAIGADVKSLGKVLGTALYKGDIAPIATKELLQNSLDAVRHLGEAGEVRAVINEDMNNPYIEISDNGKGMTKQELESVFTDLGASGKRSDEEAVGGFGLAKAAPLLGGKSSVTTTVAREADGKLYEHSFKGTPDELLEGVNVKTRQVPEGTPTGTKVKVNLKSGSDTYSAKEFVKNMGKYSDTNTKVKMAALYSQRDPQPDDWQDIATGKKEQVAPIATIKNKSAEVSITIPKDATRKTRGYMYVHLANNGMIQKSKPFYFEGEVPNAPSDIVVNVKSLVPEGHQDYPFTANRESLRGSAEEELKKYINENIVKPSQLKRKEELQKLYDTMPEIAVGRGQFPNNFGRKVPVYDAGGRFTDEEREFIYNHPEFHKLVNDITDVSGEVLQSMKDKMPKDTWERLEKVGIIFDNGLHGVHIPNPSSKKSMILINPFQAMTTSGPDDAAGNTVHTILHEFAHIMPNHGGHNEQFTVNLGEIYKSFGARNEVKALDKILNSFSEEAASGRTNIDPYTRKYTEGIQEILQRYEESRRRNPSQEDLLTGTGIKQTAPGESEEDVSFSRKSDGDRTSLAVKKLLDALESAKEDTSNQEAINRSERAKRFAAFEGVKKEGVEGAKQSLGKLRGEFEKAEPEARLKLGKQETNTLFTAIKRANITPGEKARGYTAMFKLLNGEETLQRNELQLLNDIFGNGFAQRIVELQGGIGAVGLNIAKAANTMKALTASMDLSAPLRQGIGLIHRSEWSDSFGQMLRYFDNKNYFEAGMQAIEDRPYYLLGRESGLALTKIEDFMQSEEVFANNYIHGIPEGVKSLGLKNAYNASERAYVGFLNKLRADTFDNMINDAKKAGFEPFTVEKTEGSDGEMKAVIVPSPVAKNIAKFVNNATGRGSLGKLDKIAPELNTVLWSPRLVASRLNYLNPKYYVDLDPFTRKQAIKSLFAIAAFSTTALTLSKLMGAKVSNDPTSADFQKARFGKNVLDPNGGFQQPIVAAARMMKEGNRIVSGEKKKFGAPGMFDIVSDFARSKESPLASLIDSIASEKQFLGQGRYIDRFNNKTSIQAEVGRRFVPMFIQDFNNLVQTDPSFGEMVGLGTANAFGAGIQDYPERFTNKGNLLRFNKMSVR